MKLVSKKVLKVFTTPFDREGKTFEKVVFHLSDSYLIFEVDVDKDELIVQMLNSYEISKENYTPIWSKYVIGKQIIGFWKAKNQKGYFDLFALGLNEFVPNLIISCVASQIEVGFVKY